MAIELNDIKSGYSTGLINANFEALEEAVNNSLLRRSGLDVGEANQMEVDLDMNGNALLNVATSDDDSSLVTKGYVDEEVSDLEDQLQQEIEDLAEIVASELNNGVDAEAVIRAAADANLQAQISGGEPLEASAFSPISWHDQSIDNSVNIPDEQNAWSFGPVMTITDGNIVTIGTGSFWTIAEGEDEESNLDAVSALEQRVASLEALLSALGQSEEVTLSDSQTVVTLSTLTTDNISVYIEGVRDFDFTVDDETTITLDTSYPDGTLLWVTKS